MLESSEGTAKQQLQLRRRVELQVTEQHSATQRQAPTLTSPYRLPVVAPSFTPPPPPTVQLSARRVIATTRGSPRKAAATDRRDVFTQCRYGEVSFALNQFNMAYPSFVCSMNAYSPRQESELAINIRKATSIEEVSPKRMSAKSETYGRSL